MQLTLGVALFVGLATGASGLTGEASPVGKVLQLILGLKSQVESDGRHELSSFDRYQCWCEDTLGRKAGDISTGKESITQLTEQITKLQGQLGSHGAAIAQLKKDIGQNSAAQKEAKNVRKQERQEYMAEHGESQNCIGALESAIAALAGAGTRGNFLEALPESLLLGIAADVKRVLRHSSVWHSTPAQDLDALRRFAARPTSLAATGSRVLVSAAQLGRQNPFGDYAPQSTVVQGILKGMLDSYQASIPKAREEEIAKQRAFDELMQTKTAELATLRTTLRRQEADQASKDKLLANSQTSRDDAQAQLEADEVFFEDAKESCKATATAWAERSRLRTEELAGINRAVQILNDPEAQSIFHNASVTFVQLPSIKEHRASRLSPRRAYVELQDLASKYTSIGLAQIAVAMRTGGHFDKVLVMIDQLVEEIRQEEAEDVAHRDRCQRSESKNANDMEDLQSLQSKAQAEISRLQDRARTARGKIDRLDQAMNDTARQMQDRLSLRNQEHEDFKQALKDDSEAVLLLKRAVVALSEFYKRNRLPLALAQRRNYTEDADRAPELAWQGAYGGRQAESKGIVATLSMLITDLENEIETSRRDDTEAEAEYEKDRKAMEEMMHAQKESYVESQAQLAEVQDKVSAQEGVHTQAGEDLDQERRLESTLVQDCAWVASHFQTRRDQRKAELDGLAEAKALLAGAGRGDYDEALLATAVQ